LSARFATSGESDLYINGSGQRPVGRGEEERRGEERRRIIANVLSRYHSRCLKIARGKIKEEDKYTCPICDWRVKIPRDAARPKIEDLVEWYEAIPELPFQPEEEDVLKEIIDNAVEFRQHVSAYMTKEAPTRTESETQRFFLRKIEGAEILLAYETNLLRQALHKFCPVAPEPPPMREVSLSTRKPRPTKLQKILAEHKVDNIEDLPEDARVKAQSLRRKTVATTYDTVTAVSGSFVINDGNGAVSRRSSDYSATSPSYSNPFFGQVSPLTGSANPRGRYSLGASASPSEHGFKENAMILHPTLRGDTSQTSPTSMGTHDLGKATHAPTLPQTWNVWRSGSDEPFANVSTHGPDADEGETSKTATKLTSHDERSISQDGQADEL